MRVDWQEAACVGPHSFRRPPGRLKEPEDKVGGQQARPPAHHSLHKPVLSHQPENVSFHDMIGLISAIIEKAFFLMSTLKKGMYDFRLGIHILCCRLPPMTALSPELCTVTFESVEELKH